jgi:hypothetical protein
LDRLYVIYEFVSKDEPMEMQGTSTAPGAEANKYGPEAGYSEDYGATPASMGAGATAGVGDDQGYGTLPPTGDAGQGPARNPFTQQQYDSQKSSNPFK